MERILKFRVWDLERKQFSVPFSFRQNIYDDGKDFEIYNDEFYIFQQFTGLIDKNGKEIYEGDIVKSKDFDNQMTVEYTDIQASDDMTAPGIGFQFNTCPSEMEIIGNIFETPELLK